MLSTAPDGVLSDADARAWIVRLLDRVDAGDAHAFCETDDAPAEVLSAAWLGFGPPPPPGDDGDEGAERSVREAPTSGPACWLRLERALGRCARCADAYHRRVDAWNDKADLEDGLGGDEDATVLAALLRERADARLVSRARDVRATLEKRTRERDPRSDRDTTPPDVLHAVLAVCREALAVPGCSRAPPETFDAVGAAVVAAERAPDAFDALLASRVGRADATERRAGLLRLLAHPSSEIRRVARRLFEGGRRDGGDVSARDGEASSRRRFVERVSEESAEAVDEWAATAWDAFAERQRRIREDEHASDDSRDASRNALRAAWEALAIATARMRPSARAETLARRPETLAAALDDIGGSDDAVVALAARCVAELVGGGGDVGWDSAGIPPATAVDVLEAAARKSPNETTHLAVVAAMGATLASASTARGATESNDDAYDGTNRASAFLCRVAPNSPHLFSDVVAWEARRAAVDAFRAGYLVARPSTKDHTRLATIRAMEVSARGDTRVGSGSATSVDASRIAARRSAAAAVAVMIRADATRGTSSSSPRFSGRTATRRTERRPPSGPRRESRRARRRRRRFRRASSRRANARGVRLSRRTRRRTRPGRRVRRVRFTRSRTIRRRYTRRSSRRRSSRLRPRRTVARRAFGSASIRTRRRATRRDSRSTSRGSFVDSRNRPVRWRARARRSRRFAPPSPPRWERARRFAPRRAPRFGRRRSAREPENSDRGYGRPCAPFRGDARGVARGDGRGEERRDARRPGGSSRGGGAGALLRRRRRARRRGGGFQVAGIPRVHGVRGVGDTKIARRVVVSRETRRPPSRVDSRRTDGRRAISSAPFNPSRRRSRRADDVRNPRRARAISSRISSRGRRAADLRVGETLGGRDRRGASRTRHPPRARRRGTPRE